jgi:hypothetical protein
MNSKNTPIPSVKSLINASIVAVLLALLILFAAVLPAEFGIDPTGFGKKLGLTKFSQSVNKIPGMEQGDCNIVKQTQIEANEKSIAAIVSDDLKPLDLSKPVQWKDNVKIVIPPQKGLEYKFAMAKGDILEYSWGTDGMSIYFDFHGEPKGATDGYFKSYLNAMDNESKGLLTAPFDGIHGWYWENDTDKPVTIQLTTNGKYQILGIMEQ